MRTLAKDLARQTDQKVTVAGWLHKKRLLGGLTFILVRDRSGVAQVKVEDEREVEKLRAAQIGTVLEATGVVTEDERAPGGIEIHDPALAVEVMVEEPAPIEIDKPVNHKPDNLDTLFEHRAANLRNLTEQGIFKVQEQVVEALRQYFREHEFTEIRTPKILAAATEGGAEVFKLDYFDQEATLAQSPQFYKQMMVGVFERVYEIAPAYRAEPSMTRRHMSEYISVDGEIGFTAGQADLMDFLSGLVNAVVARVWEERRSELEALGATEPTLTEQFPAMTLDELHQRYSQDTGQDTTGEKDPTPAEERWASEYALNEHGSEAIFITDFPAQTAKFYHAVDEEKPDTAQRFDLIFRGVEVVTGSQREHRYEELVKKLSDIGADPEHPGFKYYLQAFKYGLPPHGGFGLGLERLTQKIIGLGNVKEATLFPRDMNRLTP